MATPTARDSHVDRAMTQISIGYSNGEYIAPQVFPVVSVEKQSDVYFIFDKGVWFRRRAEPRAPGTRANRGGYTLSTASYLALPYAFAAVVPDEVRDNADEPLRPDVEATEFATDALLLDMEIRVADLVSTCGNWLNASNPSASWTADNSNPFADIDNIRDAISKQIGRMPNVAVMSWDIWKALRNHPDFLDRVKYTRAGGRVETSDIAAWFEVEKVLVGTGIKENALQGATSNITRIWGNAFWMGYVAQSPSLRNPSAGYVFEWKTRMVERFREDQEHQDVFSAEQHCAEKITASDAGGGYYSVV